ncbi:MAG: YitT family protein [Oscillospiraceae bacterium]
MQKSKVIKLLKETLIMLFGMFVGAVAVHFFLKPSGLVIGSISGLAIVIEKLTNIPISILTFGINAVLLVLAAILIGKEFGAKTVITSLMLSPFLAIFEKFMPVKESIMQDPWLDLLCFVLLVGFSQTILFRINASTGGLDIIAKIVNKYFHADMGTSVTIAGAMICMTAFLVNDLRLVIIGLIGTYVNGVIVNEFSVGFNSKKRACIISNRYKEIQKFIVEDLYRGVTLYNVVGGYKNEEHIELETLLTRAEFAKLMEHLTKNNIDAFVTAGNVSEIYGIWNDKKPNKVKKQSISQ